MRFLDLDLDFFLNYNAYYSGSDNGRLGPEYKPWSASRVQHFLEDRCGLSHNRPVRGRTLESHESVLDLWHTLIESGNLSIPFEVVHIDAHPDLWVGGGLYLTSGFLHINSADGPAMLKNKPVHAGNFLTFAIAYGWIASLIWVTLSRHLKALPKWDGDARSILVRLKKIKDESAPMRYSPTIEKEFVVPFKVLPWNNFRTGEAFDYIALSRSPSFTPHESDNIVPVIAAYMKQI
jgi:hypothetical protein